MTQVSDLGPKEIGKEAREDPEIGFFWYLHSDYGHMADFDGDGENNYVRAQNNIESLLTPEFGGDEIRTEVVKTVETEINPDGDARKAIDNYKNNARSWENYPATDRTYVVGGGPLQTVRVVNTDEWRKETGPENLREKLRGETNYESIQVGRKRRVWQSIEELLDNPGKNGDQPAYFTAFGVNGSVNYTGHNFGDRSNPEPPRVVMVGPRGKMEYAFDWLAENLGGHKPFMEGLFPEEDYPVTHDELLAYAETPEGVDTGIRDNTEGRQEWKVSNYGFGSSDWFDEEMPSDFPENWEKIE